ncbi:bifunctional phosphoribosylaminoimidazolecarboxamide formyltransferase/IMP cyclohydrolase [Rubellimicrobium aerolatum]|uniref:Bifunctional purine biosynthesis protein PurH n=1 Tax=Rubellimicrobium aerolatum TaxID=490979 RepID=A0ABW0SGK4_9RHOB|nr:bifunctional phosphoribosylaminoimidazolecarboxamide formyltransferase/IMP cyclohydrolase [Rubellimicrobium aerolatum]MBP1806648.1 phosphoribosylaminoimidazolecarboxamide formyltransferase/IMP cyclohydrolase [Rubellimicrobium aerolatum]
MTQDLRPIRRALLSVSDKAGLLELATGLAARGVALVSTGNSAGMLREAGLDVTEVAEVTGSPEMLGGRVKTLHPRIHGGILGKRGDAGHVAEMEAHGIAPIDLVVVNLYPFEATVARGAGFEETVEQIDVGGPAMIRAAAKNHADVAVLTDPADYPALLAELEAQGGTTGAFRRGLARKAFARTAEYDAAISGWMAGGEAAPGFRALTGRLVQTLRYGENPHQRAAFYRGGEARAGVATAMQVQGKELSYNNIADTDAAYELAAEFPAGDGPACVIVKHANPCGVATGATLAEAYGKALACDPVSAFGGIVALNRPLDAEAAEAIAKVFTEVVIAPDADEGAREVLARKGNLRLLLAGGLPEAVAPGLMWKQVAGGFLVQDRDAGVPDMGKLRVVTRRAPTEEEMRDLLFAWRVAKHVKSNAIVLAKGGATVGIGAGQMSRVDSVRIAARKMGEMAAPPAGPVVASDAFFPFADGLLAAAEAGAVAAIQPGGSMRDAEVIAAADAAGMAMVFTDMRHFRH